jgi:hypothetical protein
LAPIKESELQDFLTVKDINCLIDNLQLFEIKAGKKDLQNRIRKIKSTNNVRIKKQN